jgi:hypothetical protein
MSLKIAARHPFLAFAGANEIASNIERVSRVRDLLGRETVPSQLLGSVIADAGFGLILATAA